MSLRRDAIRGETKLEDPSEFFRKGVEWDKERQRIGRSDELPEEMSSGPLVAKRPGKSVDEKPWFEQSELQAEIASKIDDFRLNPVETACQDTARELEIEDEISKAEALVCVKPLDSDAVEYCLPNTLTDADRDELLVFINTVVETGRGKRIVVRGPDSFRKEWPAITKQPEPTACKGEVPTRQETSPESNKPDHPSVDSVVDDPLRTTIIQGSWKIAKRRGQMSILSAEVVKKIMSDDKIWKLIKLEHPEANAAQALGLMFRYGKETAAVQHAYDISSITMI